MVSSAVSVLASLICLTSPVKVQNENVIILEEFRLKLVKPASYHRDTKDETPPVSLSLDSPDIKRYTNTQQAGNLTLSLRLIGGITLITMPKPKTGLETEVDNALPSDSELTSTSKLLPGLVIQNKAKIKVAGRDALAVLASLDIQDSHGIQEEATLRLIYMVHKNTRMIWLFATMSADFEENVKDFERTIASIRFLDDPVAPAPKAPAPTAKPAPAPKRGSKKR